jgi:copper chaperone CopZ
MEKIMKTITFKVSSLHNEFMEKTILDKLQALDGVLDVSVNPQTQEVTLATLHPETCEGVYCLLEDAGYEVHRPVVMPACE